VDRSFHPGGDVDEIDLERRRANARGVGALIAVVWALLGIYLGAVGDREVIVAVELGIAGLAVVALFGVKQHLALSSTALVALPLLDNIATTMLRGHPRLSMYASSISPMLAGLLFTPRGVLLSFGAAAGTIVACYVVGMQTQTPPPIPPEQIMVVALAVTCFAVAGGALASSSTARALELARRQQRMLAEGDRQQRKRLVEAQERERSAIARELHDDFGQMLVAVRLAIESGRAGEAIGHIDETLSRTRNLALSLRPAVLDEFGLHAALRSFVDRQAALARFKLELLIGGEPVRLPEPIEIACFRLVQEALTNVTRHAGARHVQIRLDSSVKRVEIAVEDDGGGFDLAAARARAAAGASLGLLGMEERVALAGGHLALSSAPGQGTTVRAHFELG